MQFSNEIINSFLQSCCTHPGKTIPYEKIKVEVLVPNQPGEQTMFRYFKDWWLHPENKNWNYQFIFTNMHVYICVGEIIKQFREQVRSVDTMTMYIFIFVNIFFRKEERRSRNHGQLQEFPNDSSETNIEKDCESKYKSFLMWLSLS